MNGVNKYKDSKTIPVMKPLLPPAESVLPYLKQMDEARIYSNRGPLVTFLENRIATHFYVSQERVVLAANATLALQGVMSVSRTDTYIVPSYTFAATGMAVLNARRNLRMRDVSADSWQLDVKMEHTDSEDIGYVKVLPFGAPVSFDDAKNRSHVVIDAAASLGSSRKGLESQPENFDVVFSLHATKIMGIGEGGVVVFGSVDRAKQFRQWLNFGIAKDRRSEQIGTNAKMPEAMAAYGLAMFDQMEIEISQWHQSLSIARRIESEIGFASIVSNYKHATPYWILDFKDPSHLVQARRNLELVRIDTRHWWNFGCHDMPAFADYAIGSYPNTDYISRSTLGLPMFRNLPEDFEERVLSAFEL